ncbi:MAG: response regulator [Deltaproteobacteria bacterium]|nr:response regulator [Deltaproteobacteria bacterium]
MTKILVVDDEPHILDVVRYALEREGFAVDTARHGKAALEIMGRDPAELVILDILMPELDGLSVCRTLRKRSQVPVIFLTSRADEVDRVVGLELGGDDYVTKPFSPRELVSRVRAVLRRTRAAAVPGQPTAPDDIRYGEIEIDVERHAVRVAGAAVALTVTEFNLLRALLERPGRVLSRDQLIDRAYAFDNHVTERTIDTHVRRIRAKLRELGSDPIETVHGVGYRAREVP